MTKWALHRWIGILGAWLLLGILAGLGTAYAATGGGGRDRQVALLFIYVILVVGLQIFTGNSGVFSLGHMAFGGIAGYTVAILTAQPTVKSISIPNAPLNLAEVQLSLPVGVLVGVGVAFVVATVVGLALSRLSGLGAIIVTLAWLVVVQNVIINWDTVTGGAEALYGYPTVGGKLWPIVGAFGAVTLAQLFRRSELGLRLQASREDELAAAATGVSVVSSRLIAWVISATVVGLGGVLLTLFVGTITPHQFFIHLTLLTLAMLVLGGMKSVTGAVLGSVVVFTGSELTRYLGDGPILLGVQLPRLFGLSTLFLGSVLLFVMILRPKGLVADWEVGQALLRWVSPRNFPDRARKGGTPAPPGTELRVDQATKVFQGLVAVDSMTLRLETGEIVGLIGPNGAGKTTLLNMITGIVHASSGTFTLNAEPMIQPTPVDVARRGIARTFQNIRLFEELSVRENVAVAASVAARHRPPSRRIGVEEALERFGLIDVADQRANQIPYGRQRHLELARAVVLAPDLLLLDEPSAGLNEVETGALMAVIRKLGEDFGFGILIVDHDLAFIMSMCGRIYVMNEGRLIASATPQEVQRDPEVIRAYLGTPPSRTAPAPTREGPSGSKT